MNFGGHGEEFSLDFIPNGVGEVRVWSSRSKVFTKEIRDGIMSWFLPVDITLAIGEECTVEWQEWRQAKEEAVNKTRARSDAS